MPEVSHVFDIHVVLGTLAHFHVGAMVTVVGRVEVHAVWVLMGLESGVSLVGSVVDDSVGGSVGEMIRVAREAVPGMNPGVDMTLHHRNNYFFIIIIIINYIMAHCPLFFLIHG